MTVIAGPDFDDHEHVAVLSDRASGLHAVMAVYRRVTGAAMVACRMNPYPDETAAVIDALRLSRSMTLSNLFARLPFGGGAVVISGQPREEKTPELLSALGKCMDSLDPSDMIIEDLGLLPAEIKLLREAGHGIHRARGLRGDMSAMTAFGVFRGLQAAVSHRLGRDDLTGIRVAVQGLGRVGMALADRLHEAGARLVVADVNPAKVSLAEKWFRARGVSPDIIHAVEVDVFAPCAAGATLTDPVLAGLQARVVAGSAHHQLARRGLDIRFQDLGILLAPDFVLNAGGALLLAEEVAGGGLPETESRVNGIYDRMNEVLRRADRDGCTPCEAAEAIAFSGTDGPRRRAA